MYIELPCLDAMCHLHTTTQGCYCAWLQPIITRHIYLEWDS